MVEENEEALAALARGNPNAVKVTKKKNSKVRIGSLLAEEGELQESSLTVEEVQARIADLKAPDKLASIVLERAAATENSSRGDLVEDIDSKLEQDFRDAEDEIAGLNVPTGETWVKFKRTINERGENDVNFATIYSLCGGSSFVGERDGYPHLLKMRQQSP